MSNLSPQQFAAWAARSKDEKGRTPLGGPRGPEAMLRTGTAYAQEYPMPRHLEDARFALALDPPGFARSWYDEGNAAARRRRG